MDLRCSLVALAAACVPALAHGECTPAEIAGPVRGSTRHDARPEIRWGALSGAEFYRVQIESRVPEGRVLERIDARVSGDRFVPPRPLAEGRAAVKVLVTADCSGGTSIATRPAWFFIDMAPGCPAVRGFSLSGESAPRAQWTPGGGATRYEVEAYSASDGRLIVRKETTLGSVDLPHAKTPLVVAVRPRCGPIVGEAAYGRFSASR